MRERKKVSTDEVQKIAVLLMRGDSVKEVCQATGIGHTKVYEVRRTISPALIAPRNKATQGAKS